MYSPQSVIVYRKNTLRHSWDSIESTDHLSVGKYQIEKIQIFMSVCLQFSL